VFVIIRIGDSIMSARKIESLVSLITRPASGRRVIAAASTRLRPGLYLNTGGTLWRHWRVTPPDHVRGAKGAAREGRRAKLLGVLFPKLLWVRRTPSSDGYPIAIAAAEGECVLLNPALGRVARIWSDTPLAAEHVEWRTRWAHHVPSPTFHVAEGGHVLVEEYVRGSRLQDAPFEMQLELARRVFRAYTTLVREEGSGTCRVEISLVRDACARGQLPAVLCHHLREPDLLDAASTWPLVPTGSDNAADNVVVVGDGDDAGPVFIDCMPIRRRLFFSHPVGITAGWLVPALRQAYFSGAFDSELAALFAGAGIVFPPAPTARQALLALSIALNFGPLDSDRRIAEVVWLTGAYGLERPDAWLPASL